jgi:hypothetical protein
MQKLKIIGAFLMLLSGFVNAQPITGLGDIKIGMTTEKFLSSEELKNKNVRDISTQLQSDRIKQTFEKSNNIIWKKDSESKVDSSFKIYLTGVTEYEFIIPLGVKTDSGVDLYEVKAKFYDDKLISIQVPNADFKELLTAKYGKPLNVDKTIKCLSQNEYGLRHFNGSINYIWGEGKPIKAQVHSFFYDCGRVSFSYYIEDVKKVAAVSALERKIRQEQKNSETNNKASASKL